MKVLRIFNPEHDLALAFGGTNYTPPPMARLLRRDLQLLPMWIGCKGDCVLSQDGENDAQWVETVNRYYDLGVNVVSVEQIPIFDKILPWGWNHYLRRRLVLDDAQEQALPSIEYIDNIRMLSHRRISIEIHRMFLERVNGLHNITPMECYDIESVLEYARKHPCAYTKAPWSSSGKGIYRALDINGLDFTRWVSGIIKRQGSIMCERPLNAVLDFAMEFKCEGGKSEFIGYSVFNNDTHSSFSGGLIGATDFLHKTIVESLGDEQLLCDVRATAVNIVDNLIAPQYNGYLGIDMMIYRDENGELCLNPCIELNLRTTMGVVSSVIGNNFLAEGVNGTFYVDFHRNIVTEDYRKTMVSKYPLQLTSYGKIKSGVQFLTPLYSGSQYSAYIKV